MKGGFRPRLRYDTKNFVDNYVERIYGEDATTKPFDAKVMLLLEHIETRCPPTQRKH